MQLLVEQNLTPKERSDIRDTIRSYSSDYSKMILALLTEMMVFHISFSLVDAGEINL